MFDLSVQAAGIVEGKGPQLEWLVEKKNLLENSNNEFYDLHANKFFTIRKEIMPWRIHLRIWFLKVAG
jgi:hypothetical protein